ncbi:MAG: hypothetical protein RR316_04985 [Clostridia bacterium]
MNKKLIISLVLTFALCLAMMVTGNTMSASALDVNLSKDLFSQTTGGVKITVEQNGVQLTLLKSNTTNAFAYKQNAYMEGFELETETNLLFDKVTFLFTELNDSSNNIEFVVEKTKEEGKNVFKAYTKKDAIESEKVVVEFVSVDPAKVADEDMFKMTISYNGEGHFLLNGTVAGKANKFDYNVAKFSVSFYNAKALEKDTVVIAKSMSNIKGKQLFTVDGIKEDALIEAVIWQKALENKPEGIVSPEGTQYAGKTIYTYEGLKAKAEAEYEFPVYGISMVGKPIDTIILKITREAGEVLEEVLSDSTKAENPDSPRLKYTVGKVNSEYEIRILNKTEVHILRVTTIVDTVAPKFDEAALKAYILEKLPNGILYTKDGTTMPNLKVSGSFIANLFVFPEEDNKIDNLDNIRISFGYKKPNTSSWVWGSNYTISFTAEGVWCFKYKVSDVVNNFTESEEFTRDVIDNTPPVISKATEQLRANINELFKIPDPTITDNESGVDIAKTTIRLFKGVKDGDFKEIQLSKTNSFTPDELTQDNQDYSYFVEYTATDYRGNVAETKYSYITVGVPTEEEKEPNKPVDWLVIALIALAVVLVVVIALLIFVKPKDEVGTTANNSKVNDKKNKK